MQRIIKLILFAIFIFETSSELFAQEVPEHPKKVYQSAEGKIFWPKDLPVFIRLSASEADSANSFLMKSERTKKHTNPYYLDTEGINYIRSKWAVDPETKQTVYPKFEVVWEVYRDGTPPVSQMSIEDDNNFRRKSKIYLSKETEIKFSAKDAMSGVEAIFYSIDSQPFKKYENAINLAQEKEYLIKSYSVDRTGNVESLNEQKIIVDFTAPSSSKTVEGTFFEQTLSGKNTIKIAAKDNSAGLASIYYQIDTLEKKKYFNSIRLGQLEEGDHQLYYYAVDSLGNEEQQQSYSFYIDNTPPIITSDLLGDSFITNGKEFSSGRTRIKLTAIDNKAGVDKIYYQIEGGEYQVYEKPFFLPAKQGDVKISYYAIDQVGNKSHQSAGRDATFTSPYLDLTAPRLSHQFVGDTYQSRDTIFINTETKIKLIGSDSESGMKKIEYKFDGDIDSIYTQPFAIKKAGIHEINMIGYDNVNNSNSHRFFINVDSGSPEITSIFSIKPYSSEIIAGEKIPVLPLHTQIFLAATDDKVGLESIFYSINGQEKQRYNKAIDGFSADEIYQIAIEVMDKLGNQSTQSIKFKVK